MSENLEQNIQDHRREFAQAPAAPLGEANPCGASAVALNQGYPGSLGRAFNEILGGGSAHVAELSNGDVG